MKLSESGLRKVLCDETKIKGLGNTEFEQSDFQDCVLITLDEAFTAQAVLRAFCGKNPNPEDEFIVLADSIFKRIKQAERSDE